LTRRFPGSCRYLTAAIWIAYVVTPVRVGAPMHGIPLGGIDTCALLAIVWVTARGRRLPGPAIVAAALVAIVALAAMVPADRGLRARYFANPDAHPPFERSTEYRSRSFTRIDGRLEFAPRAREFPLAFFNDIARFNVGAPNEPDRERLSFSVYWEGLLWQRQASTRTLFVDAPQASAQIVVDDQRVVAVKPGDGVATAVVELSPGWHRLEVRFSSPYSSPRRFAAGQIAGDRRVPFGAGSVVTRQMGSTEMLVARFVRVAKTVVDIALLAWLTFVVTREIAALRARRRSDGAVISTREEVLGWFGIIAIVEAYVFASPWLTRLFVLGGGDDPITYEFYARNIQLNGLLLRIIDGPYYYQVFYPYFLAAIHTIFGEGMFGVMLVQRLLVALTVWLCVDIAVRIGGDAVWPAAFGCAALVGYVKLAPISASPLNESLFAPLLVTWTAAMVRLGQVPTGRRVIGTGLLGGVTALTRTTALLAWVVVFPACWISWRSVPRRSRLIAALAACSIALVALIAGRNWIVVHEFVPLPTELPITLVAGNEPPPGLTLDYTRRASVYDRFDVDPLTRRVLEYALTAPGAFAANMARKVLFAIGVYEPYAPGWGFSAVFIALSIASVAGFALVLRSGVAPAIVVCIPALIAATQFAAVVVVYPKGERLILPFHLVLVPYAAAAIAALLGLRFAVSTTPLAARLPVSTSPARAASIATLVAVGLFTLFIRTRGISEHFLMLGDQIRDWSIALGPFSRLPLVGTPSTAGGNSFGPIFYWVLWLIRVSIGPLVDNLPHAGGIGLAAAQSIADVVLCAGIKRASGSWTFAVATTLIIASSPFDLALSSVIWNPVLSVAFAKTAAGLVLFWGDRMTRPRRIVLCVVAWLAVQAHSAALPFAAAVFLWIVLIEWRGGSRRIAVTVVEVAAVVLVLQLPSAFARESIQPTRLWALLLHPEELRPLDAFRALGEAVASIAAAPFQIPHIPLILLACGTALLVSMGPFEPIVIVTVLPLVIAVGLWSLWQGEAYEAYAFLTLAPATVLMVVWPLRLVPDRSGRAIGAVVLLAIAIFGLRPRMENATLVFRQPSYGALVRGSRALVARGEPIRRIEAPFLPALSDPEFVYTILGGTFRRDSQTVVRLSDTGEVTYIR